MFLPETLSGSSVEFRLANYLRISTTGRIMDNLRWLGLLSPEPAGIEGRTAADALIFLLERKLALPEGARDAIVLLHDVEVRYPEAADGGGRRERIRATLVDYGEPGDTTAMAKAVGLPAGIAVRLLMAGELPLTGCHVPTHPAIFEPVLRELEAEGLRFEETVEPLERVEA